LPIPKSAAWDPIRCWPIPSTAVMKNHRVAAAEVELIAPTSNVGRKKPLSEFHLDAAGDVTVCPAVAPPGVANPKRTRNTAPYLNWSPVKPAHGCRNVR
jgi:hypothetical protein